MPAIARVEKVDAVGCALPVRDQSKGAHAYRVVGAACLPSPHGAPAQRNLPLFRIVRPGPTGRLPTGVDGDSQRAGVHHAPATEQPAMIAADGGTLRAVNPAPAPPPRCQLWSVASVAILCADYPTAKPVRAMSVELGRSVGAIYGKARRLHLKRPRRSVAPAESDVPLPAPVPVPQAPQPSVASAPEPPRPMLSAPQPALPIPQPTPAPKTERTKMGGRPGRWTENDGALSERLERLFIANFSPGCISAVLGVTERAVATRAWVVNCPRRDPQALRHDVEAARLLDRLAAPLPRELHCWRNGKPLVRKRCRRKGHFIWGTSGITLSNDAKRQIGYKRLTSSAPLHAC